MRIARNGTLRIDAVNSKIARPRSFRNPLDFFPGISPKLLLLLLPLLHSAYSLEAIPVPIFPFFLKILT